MIALPHTILTLSDSRGVAINDVASYDFITLFNETSTGTGYTVAGGLPTATSTGGDGTGLQLGTAFQRDGNNNLTGGIHVAPVRKGKGFNNPANVPTVTLSGGAGSGWAGTPINAGGWNLPLEQALQNAGLLTTLQCAARSGAHIQQFAPFAPGLPVIPDDMQSAIIMGGFMPACVPVYDIGVNDDSTALSASAYQVLLASGAAIWLALGCPAVILDMPYAVPTGSTYVQGNNTAATLNATIAQYGAAVQATAASNPTKIFVGASLQSLIAPHREWFKDSGGNENIHMNAAGDMAMGAFKAAAYAPILKSLFGSVSGSSFRGTDGAGSRGRKNV